MPRTWLMATHDGPRTDTEAESVLVEHDGEHVTFTFDDGDEWTFERRELVAAVDAAAAPNAGDPRATTERDAA